MNNQIYMQIDKIEEDYKSKIIVGNITMFCLKKFNWFQRKMLKMFFGFEVENIGDKEND